MALWMGVYRAFIMPHTSADEFILRIVGIIAVFILTNLGYSSNLSGRNLNVETGGLWLGDNCSGLGIIGIFIILTLLLPASPLRKQIHLLAGISGIILLNTIRMVVLAIMSLKSRWVFDINHTLIFNAIVYTFVLVIILMQVKSRAN